jgi:hypothetical protein
MKYYIMNGNKRLKRNTSKIVEEGGLQNYLKGGSFASLYAPLQASGGRMSIP